MFDFFQKNIFGLDISDYSIEMVSLGGTIEKPRLLAMSREILEAGTVENGKVLNKEKLEAVLKKIIKKPKFGKLRNKKFIFSIPESKAFIHSFELKDDLEKNKIEKEIEIQAINNFPFPTKDLYYDFKIKNKEVFLIACPRDIIEDYLAVFRRIKILPIAAEIESISLARALIGESKETILIADIGTRTTNLSIFSDNRLRLSISINIAGDKFSQALMEKLNITFLEAENSKKEIGLNSEKEEGKVFNVLQKEIQQIIAEIQKFEDYFREKERKTIGRVILAGGSAALPNLVDYLAENLERSVMIGDPWEKINIDILRKKEYFEKALEINPALYAGVIGSALRGLTANSARDGINLLPKH